jgi:hypothetical protein
LLWLLVALVAPPVLCLLPWIVANVLTTMAAAAAITSLVWILCQSWYYDRSYTPRYVPKRLQKTFQFIQWLKSKAKCILFNCFEMAIYGL